MTSLVSAHPRMTIALAPTPARALLLLIIIAALGAGFWLTPADAAARAALSAGADLTRLLRGMAAIKLLMAAAAATAVLWRLGTPVSVPWLAAYGLACAAMAAGPGLIWDMNLVRTGALLLHGGLLATLLLVWRDPAVSARLAALLAARRATRSRA